jgi:hypothetical protein
VHNRRRLVPVNIPHNPKNKLHVMYNPYSTNMISNEKEEQSDLVDTHQSSNMTREHTGNNTTLSEKSFEIPTEKDMFILKKQLKKEKLAKPHFVLKRCKWGYPQVTFTKSNKMKGHDIYEESKDILPGTFVWLTCPRVRELVSRLEGGDRYAAEEFSSIRLKFGASVLQQSQKVKKEKAMLKESATKSMSNEEKSSEELQQTHKNYEQWLLDNKLLTKDELAQWATSNKAQTHEERSKYLQTRFSNAGMSSPHAIKCLHSHVGPYMAGANDLVGKETFDRAMKLVERTEGDIEDIESALDCRSNCITCRKYDSNFEKTK